MFLIEHLHSPGVSGSPYVHNTSRLPPCGRGHFSVTSTSPRKHMRRAGFLTVIICVIRATINGNRW